MKTINNVLRAAIMVAVLPGPVFGQAPAPPVQVLDIAQGPASSTPRSFVVKEGVAYFAAKDADHGTELWRTDGTPSGTYMVRDIRPGAASSGPGDLWPDTPSSAPASLVEMGGYVYFVANDGVHGQELWRSDGTPGGTAMVLDALPGAAGSLPEHLTSLGGTLFFKACHTSTGCELWKSDGTAAGTSLVADIRSGSQSSFPQHFATLGGLVLFAANDNIAGEELWRSDGTAGGTVLLKNIDPTPLASPADGQGRSYPQWLTRVGDGVLFIARDATHGYELWRTDGTASGTAMLVDLSPGADSGAFSGGPSSPVQLVDDKLFFLGKTSTSGEESIVRTMVSDGTTAGTHQAGSYLNDGSRDRARLGSFYYFAEGSAADGAELWRADTSALNAIPFASLAPGTASSSPKFFQTIGESVFFTANGAGLGEELWRTDGTAGGTVRLSDINPGSGSSSPSKVIQLGDVLLFTASDGATGVELWAFALNRAPIAQAGSDLELPEGATAELDGSTSTDPDADPLTFEWRDANDVVLGTEATLAVSLPNGVHDITLTVSDGQASAADTVRVTVGNTRPLGVTVVSFEDGVGSVDIDQPPGVCDGVAGGSTTCSSDAAFESIVTLTATPSPLSVFTGWSGACSGVSPSCTVTMSSDQNVTATFRGPQTLTIQVASVENGIGTVSGWVNDSGGGPPAPFTCDGVAGSMASCTLPVRVGSDVFIDLFSGALSVLDSVVGCSAFPNSPVHSSCQPTVVVLDDATFTATFRGPQSLTIQVASVENGIGTVSGWVNDSGGGPPAPFTCDGVAGSMASCTLPVRVGSDVFIDVFSGALSVLDSVIGCSAFPNSPGHSSCQPTVVVLDDATLTATFRGPQTLTIQVASVENGIGTVSGWVNDSGGGPPALFTCDGVAGSMASCTLPVRVGSDVFIDLFSGALSVLDSVVGCSAFPNSPVHGSCQPTVVVLDDATFTATFRGPQSLTIQVASFENGIGTVSGWVNDSGGGPPAPFTCDGVAGSMTSCTLPVRVGSDVFIDLFSGALSVLDSVIGCSAFPNSPGHSSCQPTVVVLDDATLTATFRGPRELSISFGGDGSGDVVLSPTGACASGQTSCAIPVAIGAVQQLTATPAADSLFQAWLGACAGQGAVCSLTITDDVSTQAVFVLRNHPPVADAGGPYSGVRNQPIAFNGAASTDPEPDALTYSWDFGDGSPAGTGVAPTHAYATTGTFTVTLTVNDGTVNSAPVTTTVTIVNQAPTANAGGPYSGVRNQAITFSGAASSDPDGDALAYSWDFGDGSPAGTGVAPTHAYTSTGTFTVTLTVNDGTASSAAATATVTISNQAPIAHAGGPHSGVRNQAITFSGAASSDPDGDTLTYSWDFGDGSPAGTGVAPTHAYATTGTFTVTLTVNDGTATSTAASATVTISNQAPIANAGGPYAGVRNQAITFSGAASSDPDGDALAYSWDFGDGSPAGTGVAPTHAYTSTGTFTVTLTVNDGTTTSTAAAATVTISNQAPLANAGGPYSGVRNQAIAFSGGASSDPDGDALTYSWDFGDGSPAGTGAAPTHAYATTGTFTVTLTVNDGTVNSAPVTTTVTISNQAPIANAGGPYSGVRNQAITFSGAASNDPDGDALTYSWDFGDGSPLGTGVAPTHAYATTGTFTVTLTVNDGTVNSTPVTTTVTISNQTPVANAGGPYSGVRNQAISFSGGASSDPDGDALTYSWDFGDGSAPGTGVAPTHAYATTGTFTVTLTVNDGTTTSTAATATVTISNQAPIANAGGPYTGTRLAAITFNGSASTDPDADSLTYSWNFGDGGTATGPAPSHLYTATGTFTVTLTVNDGTTNSAPATSTVNITNVAPTVTLTSPSAGAVFHAPAAVAISAVAADSDGAVAKVEFFAGLTKVGEVLDAPYAIMWPATAPGTYSLTAVVTDSSGATVASAPVAVVINAPPTVSITAPADNAQFAAPASITVTAAAADADGSIAQVEFFRGATSLGVDSQSPYSVTWAGAPVGSYQLTAVATDNRGAVVTSTAVTVKVTATLAPTADSYVHASKSNSNFGTATEVTVQQGSSNSNIRWTYMKFDLSTIPTITDARVRLFGRVSATTTTAINTAVYSVSDTSWTETGIKWSNKPATGTTALSTAAIVNNSTTARWYEFDVSAYLQAEKAAGRNVVTLAFKNLANSSPYVTFTSREGTAANRPQVVVVP